MPKPLSSNIATSPGQGAGRPGPPGPPGAGFSAGLDLTGTSKEQTVIGFRTIPLSDDVPTDGQSYVYSSSLGEFVPATSSGGGSVPRLSRHIFVDGGTSAISQDGSVGKPYGTIQAALDIVNVGDSGSLWSIFVTPGDYNEHLSVYGDRKVAIISPGYGLVNINVGSYTTIDLNVTSESVLILRNIVTGYVATGAADNDPPNVGTIILDNTSVVGITTYYYEVDVIATGPNCYVTSAQLTGNFSADGVNYVRDVIAESVEIHSTAINGSITVNTGNGYFIDCGFDSSATLYFPGYSQTLYVDGTSHYWLNTSDVAITGSYTLVNMEVDNTRELIYSGAGSDGDLSASSGTTTLTKATYYDTVTLTGTARIDVNGWPLRIRTFDARNAPARAIFAKGADSATSTNQANGVQPQIGSNLGGSGPGSQAGTGGGVNQVGNPATAFPSTVLVGSGGQGGTGGTGGTGNGGKVGGAGTTGVSPTTRLVNEDVASFGPVCNNVNGTSFQVLGGGTGGGGGGGGGGSNGANSGGSGNGGPAGGPLLEIWIGELITGPSTPAGLIDSYGGSPSTPSGTPAGGGGGGNAGGGGGGAVKCIIGIRTGSAIANLVCANGGDGGNGGAANGGTAGGGGQAGGGGEVFAAILETGTNYYKGFQSGGGPAASGLTGGVHTTWGVTL